MQSTCPYLKAVGSSTEPPASWPSHRYRCAAAGQSRIIAPKAQVCFCLAEQHLECPFYLADASLPEQAEGSTEISPRPAVSSLLSVWVLLLAASMSL